MCLCQGYRPPLCWILIFALFSKQATLSSSADGFLTTEIVTSNTEESDGELFGSTISLFFFIILYGKTKYQFIL